ncbi:hypothetical protein EES39_31050 [Streptomyces sp. ADI92-24]|nr:hypothetical protein EES39_31050 [Streptomyces sp. ADI92-24]
MSEASRALAAIVVEHRASGHQGGAGCPAGPAAFRVHRPPGFERSRSGGERCPVRREMISDGLHRRTSHPLVNTRSLTNQADALAVLTARAGRRITASDVGWDLHRPRNRHHHLDTPGDARRRPPEALLHEISQGDIMDRRNLLMLTKAAATAPALTLLLGPIARQRRASCHAPEREARSLDRKRRPGPPGDGRLHRERQRRPHLGPRHLAEHFPGGVDWMLFDARQHPQAQRVYHTGIRLAREAGTSLTTRHSTTNLVTSAAYRPRGWATTTTLPRSWTSPRGRRSCRPLWPP